MRQKLSSLILAGAALVIAGTSAIQAQESEASESKWVLKNIGGINLSQTSLTNWAAGGENSVAWNIYFNGSANYKSEGWNWDNGLVADFGKTYTSSNKWQKSLDKLNLNTKVGHSISKHWNMSFLADFLTQFTAGYKSAAAEQKGEAPISKFFAPGYLTTALGFDYKPNSSFSMLLSPVAGKLTFVTDKALSDAGAYGVKKGKHLLAEVGTSLVANYNTNITQNINLISKLTLFSAYNNKFGNVDVNWDLLVSFKINKYLAANVTTNLVYDDDVKTLDEVTKTQRGAKIQLREVFGLGITYSL